MSARPRAPRLAVLLAPLLLLPLAGACSGEAPSRPERPHLVLVTADALRADHLSLTGYPRLTSPRLDAFARGAHHFAQAVTVIPKTGPSFATLFTGVHPERHGVRYNFSRVPPELPVLAERLRDAGYRTAAFVSNPALRPQKGYARGFDHYELFPKPGGVRAVNEAFFRWGAAAWERPTFAWLHYIDPHGPYEPPPHYEALFLSDPFSRSERRVPLDGPGHPNKRLGALPRYQQRPDGEDRVARFVARYDAEIRYVDDAFQAVLAFLRGRGLFDPSAVVFTSDHGESLGEHEFYFEHGWFAYDPGLRIPLLVKEAGQTTGTRSETPVSNLDLRPTLLDLAGLPPEPGASGQSALRVAGKRPPVLIENADRYPEKVYGVRTPRWKYLVREGDGREELYDLHADPGEARNRAAEAPPALASLRERLRSELEHWRRGAFPPAEGEPDDAETLERLRQLGYAE